MSLDRFLAMFRAAGEETRLRILALLSEGELTVSEITQILGQSQPRVSRHLKVLNEAGLVERYREGAWVFYRFAESAGGDDARILGPAMNALLGSSDRQIARDAERLRQVRRARAEIAAAYFRDNAPRWDEMRQLHLPDEDIDAAMADVLGPDKVGLLIDLGTGTGRVLEVLADRYERGLGFDLSTEMLAVARANLEKAGVGHAQVRQADLFQPPVEDAAADVVVLHQVLHYLSEPQWAVDSASRLLRPGGRLLIVDFAPHELEFLRESHAHRRLGFSDDEARGWGRATGLDLARVETLSSRSDKSAAKGDEKLTVKIWLFAAPVRARATARRKARA